jgi:hypothetical protein
MQYIFGVYVENINTIILRLMKSQHNPDMTEAFTGVYNVLVATGHQQKHHVFENKCSRAVTHYLDKKVSLYKM